MQIIIKIYASKRMATQHKKKPFSITDRMIRVYNNNIHAVLQYYDVSESCAKYMYHRAIRSTKKGDMYLPWGLQLQNAIVKADKCIGINWEKLNFGEEENELIKYGIIVSEMQSKVFRWNTEHKNTSLATCDNKNGWTTVTNAKRQKRNNKSMRMMRKRGFHL